MVELGEVFQIESGGTPNSKIKEYWGGDIKWVTLVDIPKNISTISKTKRAITQKGLRNSSAKLLPKGTILVSSRATIGRIGIAGCEIATNQGFKNIIVDKNNDSIFVAHLLNCKTDEMKNLASGGTFKEISKTSISKIKIPLPSLKIQKQIVAEVEEEEKIIQANKKLIDIMERKIEKVIESVWIK